MNDTPNAQPEGDAQPVKAKRTRKSSALPAAVKSATTGAELARALNVPPKAFRAWMRRQGTYLSKGAKLTPALKSKAHARYSK